MYADGAKAAGLATLVQKAKAVCYRGTKASVVYPFTSIPTTSPVEGYRNRQRKVDRLPLTSARDKADIALHEQVDDP